MVTSTFLEQRGVNGDQRAVFDLGMDYMDSHYRAPLLWASAKLSAWYAVGLFARGGEDDIQRGNNLIHNALLMQEQDPAFEQNYGSFKGHLSEPYASGENPAWIGKIYDSYDPNNALFVTMAGVIIEFHFADMIKPKLRQHMRQAMLRACQGNEKRTSDWHGDNLRPSYTNPWLLRCACTTFTARLMGDRELEARAEVIFLLEVQVNWLKNKVWMAEAVELFDLYQTPGEFNSPTYAGVTLTALALGQYCPPTSCIYRTAPRLTRMLWDSLAEVYNPSLLNIAGPWDRAYGYCMTQYYATTAAHIACVVGLAGPVPLPKPLIGSEHSSDAALIPLQVITAPYTEAHLSTAARAKFRTLYAEHYYKAKSIFPPHDKTPREYTMWLGHGLNIGGMSFDEDQTGGPSGNLTQFNPGVIQWDAGRHGGGVGWISIWPNNACCRMTVTADSLDVIYARPKDFPGSPAGVKIALHIGCLPFMQLDRNSFSTGEEALPGLDVKLSGSAIQYATRDMVFKKENNLHGAYYYELTYTFEADLRASVEPRLLIEVKKTSPQKNGLIM